MVDLGDLRRDKPTARAVYGNAASIFAGDWLLVEALRRVGRANVDGALQSLLSAIEEMIFAESLQLERRGSGDLDRDAYFRVVEGKTAALFRWAAATGGAAAGLHSDAIAALDTFGAQLGVAFQLVDDVLDFGKGDPDKTLFADLREGKATYPLIVGAERDPGLQGLIRDAMALPPGEALPDTLSKSVMRSLEQTGALRTATEEATRRSQAATEALTRVPDVAARHALAVVAESTVNRTR